MNEPPSDSAGGPGSANPPDDRGTPGTENTRSSLGELTRGTAYGLAAYLIWGLFPLYFHALTPAGPLEVLAHRIIWSLVFCLLVLAVRREFSWFRGMLRRRRLVAGLTVAAFAIATNWGVYVGAVLAGRTNEAALGYFLNPLLTVALGVVLLRERLRRLQLVAVLIGAVAAVYLTVVGGQVPVISLTLACSFAFYGLVKKRAGANLPALQGLTVETAVLAPVAILLLGPLTPLTARWVQPAAGWVSPGHTTLLVLTGVVTAVPLLLFAAAARRVPLVNIGMLQFLAPVMQLLCALVLGEQITLQRWIGFVIVWIALAVLTLDAVRNRPRSRRS